MGWLFTEGQTKEELVRRVTREWGNDSEDSYGNKIHISGKCLEQALRGNHLWTVWEIAETPIQDSKAENKTGRYIALHLIKKEKGYGYGYKDMDESCGPYAYDCPLKFLDMVPVPDSKHAAGWREKVRAYHQEKAGRAKKRAKIGVGSQLVLVDGLSVNGAALKELTVVFAAPRQIVGVTSTGMRVKIAPRYIQEIK